MTKGIVLLACGVLVALVLAVAWFSRDWIITAPAIAIMVLGFVALNRVDLRRQANDKARAAAYASARSAALKVAARSPRFQLKVDAASQIVLACTILLLGAVFLGASVVPGAILSHWSIFGGGIGVAAGLLLMLRAAPAVGKPKLVLDREGFSTPLTPPLSWSVVHGMDLETLRSNDDLVFQKLVFYIPSLPEHLPRFGLFHRLVYPLRGSAGRQRLEVILRHPSEPGDAVYDLAMLYWKQATGRTNEPNPLALFDRVHPLGSHEMPTSAGTGSDLRRLIEADLPDGEEKTRMLASLARMKENERRMERYQDAARAAWRERRRRARYGLVACALSAGALLYVDAYWVLPAMAGVIGVVSLYVAFFEKGDSLLPPPGSHVAGWAATLERDPGAEERIIQSYQGHKR